MQTGVYSCLLNWERKVNVFKRCLKYFSVLLLAVLLPAQAFAQLSCDGSTSGQVVTSPPFFEGDTTRLEIGIGATNIQGGSYIEIPSWSYFLDCAASDIWPSCTDQPSDVEYLGNISTNCVNGAGEPIVWNASNANEVDFVATNGPVRVLAGSQCQISFDIRTNTLAPPDNFRVRGRQGFNTGVCDNDEPGSAAGGLTIVYGSCSIDIEKQVSVTGGAPFFDADTSPGLDLEYPPGDALFQLLVTNNGTTDYVEPIKIVDPGLGIDTTIPALLAGQSATVSASGTPPLISALAASGWCTTPGPKENTSEATGVCRSSELVDASDNNNAWVNCVPPPSIAILKEISLDGNAPWFDANDAASAPVTEYDSDAYYRLTVTNDGLVDLVNVTINDATLGIGPVNIGNLAAGANTVLTSGSTGFGALYAVDRCTTAGTFLNTATADGKSAITGLAVPQASDPANLVCVPPPLIDILKEISLDGNAPWYDANDAASAPVAVPPSDAYYRITVTNTGLVDLVNVTINDATLGIGPVNIGNLAAGANTVLTSGSTGFEALYAVDRCTTDGTYLNTATADGDSAETGKAAPQVSDPANLVCDSPGMAICRTPGFWGARGGDEKADKGSRNITLEVLGDGFEICGIPITDTDVASGNSAIEAICINKGDPLAKYIRMATSAALNCNLADCGEIETVLANCNAACIADDQDTDALNACAAELGCFNEGGMYIDGQCHFAGECYFDGEPTGEVCSFDSDGDNAEPSVPCLGQGEVCERVETCHDRNLCPDLEDDGQLNGSDFCFEPPGPASSPKKCNDARKNGDYIFDF